tara:strand:+ start:368 stop:742 length:375 start_codon:yes stop_codon:yes gene_type:complete
MKLFKNYEEYLDTVITMIRDFPDKSLYRIGLAINVSSSLLDGREKIHRLNTTLKECLWDIEEAVIIGFNQYIIKEYTKTREILEYHKVNCKGEGCRICEDRNRIINKLRNKNEREESGIYAKQA